MKHLLQKRMFKALPGLFAFVLTVSTAHTAVVINEIMYDPQSTDSNREWLEIHNDGPSSVDLTNWRLTEGGTNRTFTFVQGGAVLPAGGYAVICSSAPAFLADHSTFPAVGTWIVIRTNFSSLTNTGETLILRDGSLAVTSSVTYSASAPWPSMLTGWSSLERRASSGGDNDPANWASSRFRGTPASVNNPLGTGTPVIVAMGSSTTGSYDVVWSTAANAAIYEVQESLSPTFAAVTETRWPVTAFENFTGRTDGAYHYRVRGWTAAPESGGLSGEWSNVEDMVVSIPPPGPGTPVVVAMGTSTTGSYDVAWSSTVNTTIYEVQEATTPTFASVTDSRWPVTAFENFTGRTNGTYYYRVRAWTDVPQNGGQSGAWSGTEDMVVAISAPAGSVVVNEVMYDPAGTDSNREWVEVHNKSAQAVDLTGWQIFDGSNHSLTFVQGGAVVPSGGFAVIAASASVFISEYSTAGSSGWIVIDSVLSLTNASDTVALKDGGSVVHSSLTYTSTAPWPVAVNGQTLARIDANGSDTDPANWRLGGLNGTPGAVNTVPLAVPTMDPIPAVFLATSSSNGGFLTVAGGGTPGAEAIVVVRINGNTFEQTPVTVDGTGRYSAQAGLFGVQGDVFALSVYGRQGAATTAENPAQNTTLDVVGTPVIAAMGLSTTGSYPVDWSATANTVIYELQESADPSFSTILNSFWPSSPSEAIGPRANSTYHYRVRGWTNTPAQGGRSGNWSATEDMVVSIPTGQASVIVINEIAATPASASEWVEIYNRGLNAVNLSGWQFVENGADNALTLQQGSANLPGGGFAIIANDAAQFLADHPGFSGTLFDSAWASLSTAGEPIGLRDNAATLLDSFIYPSHAAGTLERVNPDSLGGVASNWTANTSTAAVLGTPGAQNDYKWAKVYYNEPPGTNGIDTQLVNLLNSAQTRIWAAFYRLNDPSFTNALVNAKNRGVDVRAVTDLDSYNDPTLNSFYVQLENAGIVVRKDATSDLMHHKFYVIDGALLVTGSLNATVSSSNDGANHWIVFRSAALNGAFAAEFDQMFTSGLFHNNKTVESATSFDVAGSTVEVHFAPQNAAATALNAALAGANDSLSIGIYSFTLASTRDVVKARHDSLGFSKVRAIFDATLAGGTGSAYADLQNYGVNVREDTFSAGLVNGYYHHKLAIIDPDTTDDPTVVTGSLNWSNSAVTGNDENVVMVHSYDLTNRIYSLWQNEWNNHSATGTVTGNDLVINELQYNPVGSDSTHEWVEIRNRSAQAIDLTGWRLVEAGTNHTMNLVQGGPLLAAGGYAIIADSATRFLADHSTHPNVSSWIVLDSAFSLSTTGESLALRDPGSLVHSSFTYSGSAPWPALTEGQTLERLSVNNPADDPANWEGGPLGGTPGEFNAPLPTGTPSIVAMGSSTTGAYDVVWSAAANATIYEVQEATNPSFASLTDSRWPTTTFENFQGRQNGTYYYRVRGWTAPPQNGGQSGDWSAVEDMVVSIPPPAGPGTPVIVAMGTSTTGAYDVVWSTTSNTTIYEVQEATTPTFVSLTDSRWPVTAFENFQGRQNGTYYYRARGWTDVPQNGGQSGTWSNAEDMIVAISAPAGSLVVNEIMADPAGTDSNREWVEVHNKSGAAIDLTGWQIFDGSFHSLTFVQGGSVLPAGGYAVIAASATTFINEYSTSGSSGWMVMDTVLSLTNASDTVAIRDPSSVVHSSLTYLSTAPWPVAGNGRTLERIDPNGADTNPANWQAGPLAGSPAGQTLPALVVPAVTPIPGVFVATGTGGFLTMTGSAAPLSDVVVVVRVNGNTFEQSPVFVPANGLWEAQVGIFGNDAQTFQLSAYGKRGADQTAESALQATILELDGIPNLDPVAAVFSTAAPGAFMPVTGTAAPGSNVTVRVRVNGGTFDQAPVTADGNGRFTAQAGVFGSDGDVFQISAFSTGAESPRQATALDTDGNPAGVPSMDPVPVVFSTAAPGAFLTVGGFGTPGSTVTVRLRVNGNTFDQAPVIANGEGRWSVGVGIFGDDCTVFQLTAFSQLGANTSPESASQSVSLNTDGQALCVPAMDAIPTVFIATGTPSGAFMAVAGNGTPGSTVIVRVRNNAGTFDQDPVTVNGAGRYTAQAGIFGNHRDVFTLSAFAQQGPNTTVESSTQSTMLDLNGPPASPVISAMGTSNSGIYDVAWNSVPNAVIYELQESTDAGFAFTTDVRWPSSTSENFTRPDGDYHYRVRAWSELPQNNGLASAWSAVEDMTVFIQFPLGGVVVNEIMHDPAGTDSNREWVEIHNKSAQAVDLTGWQIFDGSFHSLTFVQGGSVVPAGGFAVIAASATTFINEYSTAGSSGWIVIDTVLSLTNASDTVAIRDGSSVVHSSLTYLSTAPWPVAGNGVTLERVSPNGSDTDPANWQRGPAGGNPGVQTLPALIVPAVNAVPGVFVASDPGAFLTLNGAAAPFSDVIVVVRVNGNTFEQSPVFVPANGQWEAQVGIFGADGQAFQLSAYGKRGASQTAESAPQTTVLETNGIPNLDAVAPVFSTAAPGAFIPVSGTAAPGSEVTVRVRVNGGTFDQAPVTTDGNGRFTAQAGLFGSDGDVFQISAFSTGAESPRQATALDTDGNPAGVPSMDAVPVVFSTTAPGAFITVEGSAAPGSDVIVVVRVNGNTFEQTPAFVNAEGRYSVGVGIFGDDCSVFQLSAYSRRGSNTSAENAPQSVSLDTNGQSLCVPTMDAIPTVFVATGTPSGAFMAVAGNGTPGSTVIVRVRNNAGTFDQDPVVVNGAGHYTAQAGIFGDHRDLFTLSAFAQSGPDTTVESSTQTTMLDLNGAPAAPVISAMGTSSSGVYDVAWNAVSNGFIYELQESTDAGFAFTTDVRWPSSTSENFARPDGDYHYRVRAWSELPQNNGLASDWSAVEDITVLIQFPLGGLVVNEILYDPNGTDTNREWVEIHNKSAQSVDLTGWRINDGSDHTLTFVQGGSVLPAGGFAVIAASASFFINEYSTAGSSGWMVIDSVLSLSNTSDVVAIKDAASVVHSSLTYTSTAPWPTASNGVTLERISPNGADADPSNWQAGPVGGNPGTATLPALVVPTLNAVPGVFVTSDPGGFLSLGGTAAPLSDVVVVVRVNGNTFEQSPIFVDGSGNWTGQVGIFGADAQAFQLSAYGKRGASQTAESAQQTTILETNGIPNLDAVTQVFSTAAPGAFLPLTGTAAPGQEVVPVVRINGNTFEQGPVTADANGAFTASAGIFGNDGDVFQISVFGRTGGVPTAEGSRQATALDTDGNPAGVPNVDALPVTFSTAAPGGFIAVEGNAAPGSDVIVVVRVNGNTFEQTPAFVNPEGRYSVGVGIFGADCDAFALSAYSRRGAAVSAENAAQTVTLDTNGQPVCVTPGTPVFVAMTTSTTSDYTVSWSSTSDTVIYELEESTSPVFVSVISRWPSATSESVTGQANGTYYYRVRGWSDLPQNGGRSGAWSNSEDVVVAAPSMPAIGPSGLAISSITALLGVQDIARVAPAGNTSAIFGTSRGVGLNYNTTAGGWAGAGFTFDDFGSTATVETQDLRGIGELRLGLIGDPSEVRLEVIDSAGATFSAMLTGVSATSENVYVIPTSVMSGSVNLASTRLIYCIVSAPFVTGSLTVNRLPPPDSTPPVISNLAASNINPTLATISWNTDEPATTQVEYGTHPAFGQNTAMDMTLVTTHSWTISDLSPATTYYYRVRSQDATANLALSGTQSFMTTGSAPIAAVVISEIMYDPAGTDGTHEWVEIHNPSGIAVDLTGWRLFEAGTNHSVTFVQGGNVLAAGGYAIIADSATRFLADYSTHPNVGSWLVMDSAFGLTNTGETLALKDSALVVYSSLTYSNTAPWPTAASGRSIERISASGPDNDGTNWLAGSVGGTPGAAQGGGSGTLQVPTLDPIPSVFVATATSGGGFMTVAGSGTPGSEAIIKVRVNNGTFQNAPSVVDGAGRYTSQVGIFGGQGDVFTLSVFGRLNGSDTVESATQTTVLELVGTPVIAAMGTSTTGSYTVAWSTTANTTIYELHEATSPTFATLTAARWPTSPNDQFGRTNGTYYYRVRGWTDVPANGGRSGPWSATEDMVVSIQDTTPPSITSVFVEDITQTSARVTWQTNEPADSEVGYGTTTALGLTVLDPSLATSHIVDISTLSPGTTYYYQVRSRDASGNQYVWAILNFVTLSSNTTPLGTPVIVPMGTDGDGSYAVTWNAIGGAAIYEIQQSIYPDFFYVSSWPQGTVQNYSNGPGTYYYRVRAWSALPQNGGYSGSWSAVEDVVVSTYSSPGTPTIQPMSSSSTGDYSVSWNATSGAALYELQESTDAAFTSLRQSFSPTLTSISLTGQPEGVYYYRLRAWSADPGQGGVSSPWSVVEDMVVDLPAVPSTALITPMSLSTTGNYTVTWTTCCNTTVYELEESTTPTFSTVLASYWPAVTSQSITGRTDGVYYYRVRGWTDVPENGGVSGNWSPQEDMVVDFAGSLGVACTMEIGPAGGTAPSNGFVELRVPRGVLSGTMALSITPLDTTREPRALGSPGIPVRNGYDGTALTAAEFGPDGTTFRSPVTIRLRVLDRDNDGYPEFGRGGQGNEVPNLPEFHKSNLKVFCYTGGKWVLVGGQQDGDGFISAETTHFSKYALFPAGAASAMPTERFVTPNGDGVNDRATFGTAVTRVEVFDTTGLSVWSGTGDGATAIQWAGVDEQDNALETGAYIYRAEEANGSVTHGVIVVAK